MRIIQFRVQNYRSIQSTDWIDINSVTAFIGQNEAGKSNLCEALYRLNPYVGDKYNIDEDWPVDDWGNKDNNKDGLVCEARFLIEDEAEIITFLKSVGILADSPVVQTEDGISAVIATPPTVPKSICLKVSSFYNNTRKFYIENHHPSDIDTEQAEAWAKAHLPRCVYIRDYDLPGSQVELDALVRKSREPRGWSGLNDEEQTIMIVLSLGSGLIN